MPFSCALSHILHFVLFSFVVTNVFWMYVMIEHQKLSVLHTGYRRPTDVLHFCQKRTDPWWGIHLNDTIEGRCFFFKCVFYQWVYCSARSWGLRYLSNCFLISFALYKLMNVFSVHQDIQMLPLAVGIKKHSVKNVHLLLKNLLFF